MRGHATALAIYSLASLSIGHQDYTAVFWQTLIQYHLYFDLSLPEL